MVMLGMIRLLLAAVLAVGLTADAAAQAMVCGRHDAFVAYLDRNFQEQLQSIGLTDGGLLLEVFVSTTGSGTWTILMTAPDGLACLVAAGQAWETLPAVKPEV